jgi:hypothetical protein
MPSLPHKLLSTALSAFLLCTTFSLPALADSVDTTKAPLPGAAEPASSAPEMNLVIPLQTTGDVTTSEITVVEEKTTVLNGGVETKQVAVKEIILPDSVEAIGAPIVPQAINDIMVVDNDEFKVAAIEELTFKEIPDSPDKTFIEAGARFPVYMSSTITSKTAKVGDPVEGRLKVDLKIGGKLVAPKGSVVVGHVTKVFPARKMIAAELILNKRWMRMAGSLSFDFDEIITPQGEHLPLVAAPARQARIIKNVNEGRVLGVNHNNEIASPLSTQVKHQALHLAIRAGAAAGGVFSMGAVPVAYGVMGAINPSFAFMQPVGKNMRHRRLKGFALGIVTGLPGGFLIADSIIRGPEAIVHPGDIFHAELKQNFTGEAATSAELLGGASTKVHGEQIKDPKKNKK